MKQLLGITLTGKEVYDVESFNAPEDWTALDYYSASNLYPLNSQLRSSRWNEISTSHWKKYEKLFGEQMETIPYPHDSKIREILLKNNVEVIRYKGLEEQAEIYFKHGNTIVKIDNVENKYRPQLLDDLQEKLGYTFESTIVFPKVGDSISNLKADSLFVQTKMKYFNMGFNTTQFEEGTRIVLRVSLDMSTGSYQDIHFDGKGDRIIQIIPDRVKPLSNETWTY